jgi:hypothetical protein
MRFADIFAKAQGHTDTEPPETGKLYKERRVEGEERRDATVFQASRPTAAQAVLTIFFFVWGATSQSANHVPPD